MLPALMAAVFAAAPVPPPNVVLVLIDDMGYADLGSYGARDIRTPHIDRLARQGVRLTDFYSNGPVCSPTRAALLTGRYQQRVGIEWAMMPTDRDAGLPRSEITLPRMLKDAGYRTAIFGKWHLGYKPDFMPKAHGFDEYFGIIGGNADMYSHLYRTGANELFEGDDPVKRPGYLTDLITDRGVAFIDKNADNPFFLYLPYNAVHWPFQVPDKPSDVRTMETWYDGTRADYAKMLERLDAGVGKIVAALDRHKLANRTLVIVTDDNGGERLSRNTPFSGAKGTLREGGIRVPCILRWTGRLPAGRTSRQAAASMDLTATILAAAGVTPPRPLDGRDLLPLLAGKRPPLERSLFWRVKLPDRRQQAMRRGSWKYLHDGKADLLFDLARDPGEKKDLAAAEPARVAEMKGLVAIWQKQMDADAARFPMNERIGLQGIGPVTK